MELESLSVIIFINEDNENFPILEKLKACFSDFVCCFKKSEIKKLLTTKKFDCVFISLNEKDKSPLLFVEEIRKKFPFLPIIVLVNHTDSKLTNWEIKSCDYNYIVWEQVNKATISQSIESAIINSKSEFEREERVRAGFEARSQQLLSTQQLPVLLLSVDLDGLITSITGTGITKLQIDAEKLLGRNCFTFIKDFPSLKDAINDALNGKSSTNEIKIYNYSFEVSIVPLFAKNKTIGATGLCIDITDMLQNNIKHANILPSDSLNLNRDFISDSSCKIVTPLNGIIGLSDLLIGSYLSDQQNDLDIFEQDFEQIDLTILKDIVSGNSKLLADMLEIYVIDLPNYIIDLKNSIAILDYVAIKQIVHKIKSSTLLIGLKKINRHIDFIERYYENEHCHAKILASCDKIIIQCENSVEAVKLELKKSI